MQIFPVLNDLNNDIIQILQSSHVVRTYLNFSSLTMFLSLGILGGREGTNKHHKKVAIISQINITNPGN